MAEEIVEEEVPVPTVEEEVAFHKAVEERMAAEQDDPRASMYMRVPGTTRIVQSEEEFRSYHEAKIPLEYVTYDQAVEPARQAEAKARKQAKLRAKAKAARKARRRNRGR